MISNNKALTNTPILKRMKLSRVKVVTFPVNRNYSAKKVSNSCRCSLAIALRIAAASPH